MLSQAAKIYENNDRFIKIDFILPENKKRLVWRHARSFFDTNAGKALI
jgi:hypothetical protein